MSCVNINSPEYKELVKGMSVRQEFIARIVISKFMTDNNRMPSFAELKSATSDVYNSKQGGIDYNSFYKEVKSMVKKLLPGLSDQELEQHLKFVDKLELIRLRNGKEVLTSFVDNVIYVSKTLPNERGTQAYNDIRHEVFHILFNNFLSPKEQAAIMESFKRWKPQYANVNDLVQLEEHMADSFENFKADQRKSVPVIIKEFFKKLLAFFGFTTNHYTDINKLFSDLEQGKFTRNYLRDSLVTRDKTILSKYTEFKTNLDLFLQAKAFVLNNMNELMFPGDNKNLSEATNQQLFLNQKYSSPLYQNNKEIFKLGLTKNDALKQLQKRIKDLKNTKDLDPQLSNVLTVLSKNFILKDLFDYLQPFSVAKINADGELVLKDQINDDPTEELLESDEEINSLEIGSKELINPVTKISEVVKDFLSSITYETTPGNFQNIDPGVGFISLLNLMGSMYGNTSIEDNLASLKENYNQTVKGNQTKAVYNKLKELHEALLSYNRISLSVKGVSQTDLSAMKLQLDKAGIKYEQVKDQLNIIIPANMKIENQGTNNVDNKVVFTWNRFKEGEESFLKEQKAGESNKTFVERLANETGIPNFIIARLFKYNEERNQVAELTKVANSLRKLQPKFVKVLTERQEYEGVRFTTTTYAFINKVNEYRSSTSVASVIRDRLDIVPLRRDVVALIDQYKNLKNKGDKRAMRSLLEDIIVNKLNSVSISDFLKISDRDVTQLLNNLERIVNSVADIRTNIPADEFKDSDQYLRQTSNLSNLLTKYTFEKNNPTSFSVSTSNKQKWENVMKNTSYMIFKNLEDFATGMIKGDKLLPFLKNSINNYLRFNPIFNHNVATGETTVNQNIMKVGDEDFYADHQETYFENKSSQYEKQPIPFSKESPRDWINRNFLAMFQLPINEVQTARKGERAGMSYFQQKFQPESAPNVSVIKMGVQTAEGIMNGIASMIVQEAYMNHLYGGSNRGNLVKNTKKSLLPGLEGSTYFIKDGVNIFFDANGTLNKEFGSVVNGRLIINKDNSLIKQLTASILANLDKSLDKFVDLALEERSTLEGIPMSEMYDKIKNSYLKQYQIDEKMEMPILRGINVSARTDMEAMRSHKDFQAQKEVLKKVLSAYYLNSFVNGFFMNQLSSGSTQNYKNPLDEVKRQAGVNAMNDTGLVDNQHGIKQTYKNIVIAAANNFYGKSHKLGNIPLLKRFFENKKQEVGDAQSWDIPEYKQMLKKSFGKSVDMGVITKDVHFEVNEQGGVDYRKTSSAELTNELVKKNKTLRDLRYALTFGLYLNSLQGDQKTQVQGRIDYLYNKMIDQNGLKDVNEYMEYQDILNDVQKGDFMIHKASFDSAIKGSKPSKTSSFVKNKETGTFDFVLDPKSVLTLNSSYNGIQQAIRHRYIDAFISHFTQLTYLIGLNRTETSIKNNRIITRTLAKMAKAGIYDTMFNYRMNYDDNVLKANTRSKKEFIEDLKKKLDLPGNERIVALLDSKVEGKSTPMSNPLFSEKLMMTFFNSFTKKTVTPKHPGGSFVLQSEFGFEANQIMKENSMRTPEMVTDDKGNILYAECYLPEMYSDQIKSGDLIYYNSEQYAKMFGFRIPSSDLHSSVPLRVIGYYPARQQDNVIVIPSAVTALHGSDFDVDKLFVVRYGVFGMKDENEDPKNPEKNTEETINKREYKSKFLGTNIVLGQKGIKYGYTAPDAKYDQKNNIISFGNEDKHIPIFNLDSSLIEEKEKTQNRIIAIDVEMSANAKLPSVTGFQKTTKKNNWRKLKTEQDGLKDHLDIVKSIQKGLYSNQILDAVLDNISYSGENAPDIFFGITFDPVKGYEEDSEYSQLARVYSDINKANGIDDQLAPRPKLYNTLKEAEDADSEAVNKIKRELEEQLGVDTTTKEGQEDLLSLVNENLKDSWVSDRDEFIRRQRGTGSVNINKVEDHVTVHKETYMAAGLVGLIANFSKGLAYAFHGITDDAKDIELDIAPEDAVEIDGQTFNTLSLENKDGIKTQEIRSLALNAAIDHVKEQILNVLNVGNKTAKIFLAAVSTRMSLHQATMVMLQPVAKELNSSNATTVGATLKLMATQIEEKLNELGKPLSEPEINEFKLTTKDMEKFVTMSFHDIFNDTDNSKYRHNLLVQYKTMRQLFTLNNIGSQISDISAVLSVIQGLPYNLETAYDKLKTLNSYINIEKFYNKLQYSEKNEYTQPGFKNELRAGNNILKNVNLANNENILSALEAIKVQIDVVSEMFPENSVQAQFLVNNMLKAVSNNSDPSTMFTGENDENLTFDTVKQMPIEEKYLKGKNTFNVFKLISRNIFNYLTSGLNITYNNGQHIFSLSIANQSLSTITNKQGEQFQLGAVKSYINSFLMKEGEAYDDKKNYNGETYAVSQINPEWRIKPLTIIKKQNPDNKFLRGVGVDTNFRDKVRIMTFDSGLVNTAENMAEVESAINNLKNLPNIYVRYNPKQDKWEDVPSSQHPVTDEMDEIVFNIIKASLYTDKFKFSMSKATNVIPPAYYHKVFLSLETLIKDLIYYQKSDKGDKYYKDFSDIHNQDNTRSALSDIKENLFINTIFSIPTILPNLKTVLPGKSKDRWKMLNRQAGMLPNGNIYDLYLDANILDKKTGDPQSAETTTQMIEPSAENTNSEVSDDIAEVEAESDLFERFRKNPSFIADEDIKRAGNYDIYMKVGTTGDKESNNQKFYYKKIGHVNGKLTSNSFDLNLLINRYMIKDYFNPKRFSIPTKNVDLTQDKIKLENVPISSFMVNRADDIRSQNMNKEQIEESIKQQFDILRAMPENRDKNDETLRSQIRSRINVENVIFKVNEVSLYDSRQLDRVGIKNFRVVSAQISSDKRTVTYDLEALPKHQQTTFKKFDQPLIMLDTLRAKSLSREEKIDRINSIPGAKTVTSSQNLTDAEIDEEYQRAIEIEQTQEVSKVLKNKSKDC